MEVLNMPESGDTIYGDNRYLSNLFGIGVENGGNTAKINEDRYELYVNNHLVGNKSLLNQSDKIDDVDDFLKTQGFTNFKTNLDGDHYQIEASDEDRQGIIDALSVYVNNR
jgi:hypothetical protein